jgi:hypothetical protein
MVLFDDPPHPEPIGGDARTDAVLIAAARRAGRDETPAEDDGKP